jgi:hypothetical protein
LNASWTFQRSSVQIEQALGACEWSGQFIISCDTRGGTGNEPE